MLLQADGGRRAWQGLCTDCAWLGADGDVARNRLRLEPALAMPLTSPTGFENPPSEVKVLFIHARNATGHLSIADDPDTPHSRPASDVNFCLYGKSNNLCGFARMFPIKANPKSDGLDAIKNFTQEIELK